MLLWVPSLTNLYIWWHILFIYLFLLIVHVLVNFAYTLISSFRKNIYLSYLCILFDFVILGWLLRYCIYFIFFFFDMLTHWKDAKIWICKEKGVCGGIWKIRAYQMFKRRSRSRTKWSEMLGQENELIVDEARWLKAAKRNQDLT